MDALVVGSEPDQVVATEFQWPCAGASIPIYRWRQMRHGHFVGGGGGGKSIRSLIFSFNILKCELCAQI